MVHYHDSRDSTEDEPKAMPDTTFLEADLRERAETDIQVGFWLMFFLSFITLGFFRFFTIWQLIARRDRHFRRLSRLAEDLTVYLRDRSQEAGADLSGPLRELEHVQRALRAAASERGAALWTLLCFFTSPIGELVLFYTLMSDFTQHEALEQRMMGALHAAFAALGEPRRLPFRTEIPPRSFWLYFLLMFFTGGLFAVYWWYSLITDPNRHFDAHEEWESGLARILAPPQTASSL